MVNGGRWWWKMVAGGGSRWLMVGDVGVVLVWFGQGDSVCDG